MVSGLIRVLALVLAVLLVPGGTAFAEDAGELFSYQLLEDGTARITGYKGSGEDLVFPDTVDGYTVTALGAAFGFNTPAVKNLRSITVPDTMTVIEPGALLFAEYLKEVRLDSHPVLDFRDGVLYNRERQSLIRYLQANRAEHFDVPDGIREIEDKAFIRAGLASVSFPGSLESIGSECFDQCAALSRVDLPEGLKAIGTDAFTNCDRLKEITLPASLVWIGEGAFTDNRLEKIRVAPGSTTFTVSDGALVNVLDGTVIAYPTKAEAETCMVLPGVKRIGRFAFYRCHNLKKVILPDSLREIGRGAFVSCNHLTSVDLPDSVVLLEKSAFEGNSDAQSLHIPAGLEEITDNFNESGYVQLEIPESVTAVTGSFRSLPNLAEAVIPAGVRTVGNRSFTFCRNLASVTVSGMQTELGSNFTGCAETLAIRVQPGSAAEQYCRDHGLNCEYLPE